MAGKEWLVGRWPLLGTAEVVAFIGMLVACFPH